MPVYRVLNERDFKSAKAFQNALFDDERGAYGVLEKEQRVIMTQEIKEIQQIGRYEEPDAYDGQVNSQQLKNIPKRRIAKYASSSKLGKVFRFYDPTGGVAAVEDIRPIAERIMLMLKTITPPSRASSISGLTPKNHPYRYRENFRFVIGAVAYNTIPLGADYTVIGITNVAPHASTLENPGWPRPFMKIWRAVERMSKSENFDARFSYLSGSSFPQYRQAYWEDRGYNLGDRTPFGVILGKQDYGHRRQIRYSVPVIWVGPLNSMGRTGRMRARHRRNRRKREW